MVKFYSTHCPKCKVLEMKLKQKNIEYTTYTDVDEMLAHGIKAAPALEIEENKVLNFTDAVRWVNEQ